MKRKKGEVNDWNVVDDVPIEEASEETDSNTNDVEDAPIVRFLHKMLLDAFNIPPPDLPF